MVTVLVISMNSSSGEKRRKRINFPYTQICGCTFDDMLADETSIVKTKRMKYGVPITVEDAKKLRHAARNRYAIFHSHLKALQHILDQNLHDVIVCEDDAILKAHTDLEDIVRSLPGDAATLLTGRVAHPTRWADNKTWERTMGPSVTASFVHGVNTIDYTIYRWYHCAAIYYPAPNIVRGVLEHVISAKMIKHYDVFLSDARVVKYLVYPSVFCVDDQNESQNDFQHGAHGRVDNYLQVKAGSSAAVVAPVTVRNDIDTLNALRQLDGYHRRNNKVMCNDAIIFGFTRSLAHGPSITASTKKNPELVKHLVTLMRRHDPTFRFSGIYINRNFCRVLHTDSGNLGDTYMLTLGDFVGGQLWIYPDRAEDTRNQWVRFDGRVPHCTYPFKGERYSVIFFASRFVNSTSAEVKRTLAQYGFDTEFPPPTRPCGISVTEAAACLPPELVDCIPPNVDVASLHGSGIKKRKVMPDEHHSATTRKRVAQSRAPRPSELPQPPNLWLNSKGPPATCAAEESQRRKRQMEAVFAVTGRAPRVMRKDSSLYDAGVVRYKLCARSGHEGERLLPLTKEFFYISAGGKGYACRQCKMRSVRSSVRSLSGEEEGVRT